MEPYAFDPELAHASTLPASWYWEPEVLSREERCVFGRTWQWVGLAGQVANPGEYLTATVGREPVLVARGEDGCLRAFSNVCRHRAGAVALGCGTRKKFQCQYHGWLYDLDGKLLKTPEFEGVEQFEIETTRLPAFRAEAWGPFVFVCLDATAPPLSEWLGSIPQEVAHLPLTRMKHVRTHDYSIACNWKVYVDNYLEGYHIPVAHPGLFKLVDYAAYRTEVRRFHSKQLAPTRSQTEGSLYHRNLPEGVAPEALYYWVFPNLMLNCYPDNLQINVILPDGPEKCITRFVWLQLDPERPEAAQELAENFAFSDEVQREDILLCETVQKGLRSDHYHQGRYSVTREDGLHHFHGLMAEFLRN